MTNPYANAEAWEVQTERILGDGNHVVTINEAVDGTSSGNHPQIELSMSNADGKIRDWLVITDASIGKVVALANAAGIDLPTEADIVEGLRLQQSYIDRLIGKVVGIVVRDEPDWKDATKMRPRVQGYVTKERLAQSDVPSGSDRFATAGAKPSNDLPF